MPLVFERLPTPELDGNLLVDALYGVRDGDTTYVISLSQFGYTASKQTFNEDTIFLGDFDSFHLAEQACKQAAQIA